MTNNETPTGGFFSQPVGADQSSGGPPPDGTGPYDPFAQPEHLQLGDTMKDRDIHPVVIFGSAWAGKSVLLASLLTFGLESPNAEPHLDVTYGEPLFDPASPTGVKLNNLGLSFYETKVYGWLRRQQIPGNQGDAFFVPVDVTLTSAGQKPKVHKFAFLDWEGEKLTPLNPQPDPAHISLDGQIQSRKRVMDQMARSLLEHFNRPLSVLFLLPVGTKDASTEKHAQTIASMVERYKEHRGSYASSDHCLFLLNQWDRAHTVGTPNFIAPEEGLLEEFLSSTYRSPAWSKFRSLPGNLAKMQHSSGEHDSDGLRKVYEHPHKEQVLRYPKTLWNWLFMNASGEVTFPDVMPPPPPPPPAPLPPVQPPPEASELQKLMSWLNRI